MVRSVLIDLNPIEISYHPFMISLDKYSKSCNSVDDLCKKICVPSKTKDVNVKVFNMTTNRNEEKTLEKQISCYFKCKFDSTTCDSNQKLNNETCQCDCKNYRTCKKIIVGILSHVFAITSSM